MPAPDKNYRANPSRAIYIQGRITGEMAYALTPRINELRLSNSDPITVYIDSLGGSIPFAESIRCLITTPNQNGEGCHLITVVTGTAGSAAADFLALGDYAIAYRHCEIRYHGSRQYLEYDLTYELASLLAKSLEQTNERFAMRLASRAFRRFIWRVLQLEEPFLEYRTKDVGLQNLIKALGENLAPGNRNILREALAKQRVIRKLTTSIREHMQKFKSDTPTSAKEFQAEMLRAIISYKAQVHKDDPWDLSEDGFREIGVDFKLLNDFYFGSQKKELDRLLSLYGRLFLDSEDLKRFKALNEEQQRNVLREKVAPKMGPLWYFVVSVCRVLQTEEWKLQPAEAYWLGLVDEVPGSGLPNDRELVESLPEKAVDPAADV